MGNALHTVTLSRTCQAPAAVVYDLLANLRTHREWGGTRQRKVFRLLSLEAPDGPCAVDARFSSTGAIPGTLAHWQDRSLVTEANRPAAFEFVTEGVVQRRGAKPMEATYVHRYEIVSTEDGCSVTYTLRETRNVHPIPRVALPLIRDLTWSVGIPLMLGRGFRNLLTMAEQQYVRDKAISDQPSASQ